jgi:arylsulfatase A-like enzyme
MKQPNFLFILIDDLGARDLGCFGSTFYETPRLDRLAREGMQFDRAYAACPVCSPTRAAILSGKYPARIGITNWLGTANEGRLRSTPYLNYLPLEERSIASVLREERGYQTWHIGKWHLGDEPFFPEKHGFDLNIGGCHWGHPWGGHFSPWKNPTMPDAEPGKYLADHLTDEAIRLIRTRDRDRPFYLNLWHYSVHFPIQAPADLVEKYRRKAARLGLDKLNPMVEGEWMEFIADRPRRVVRRMFQSDPVYAAMVENLDTNVGRLMDALEAEGLAEDTVVIFTSDNGGVVHAYTSPTCNLPLREGKGWAEEGGTRVSQIIRWPARVKPGGQCDVPVTSTDFYPTILEAAGLPLRPEQHVDGVSMMPLLEGGALEREALYWHYPHYSNEGNRPASWVVAGDWKLIEYFEDGRLELFHLASDPGETIECGEMHPEIRARLRSMLKRWREDVEAKIPEPNPQWEARRPRIANNARE